VEELAEVVRKAEGGKRGRSGSRKRSPLTIPMLFSQLQTAASPKSVGGWQKLLSSSSQMGGCVPMGADNLLRRSSSTGKGSLSRGNNRLRRLLCELRVFPTNSLLRASLS